MSVFIEIQRNKLKSMLSLLATSNKHIVAFQIIQSKNDERKGKVD